jgi:hypothetical protein
LTEQCGDVYENKGPLWKIGERSGNVYENKGSYLPKAGMLLKTNGLSFRMADRFQAPGQRLQIGFGMAEA